MSLLNPIVTLTPEPYELTEEGIALESMAQDAQLNQYRLFILLTYTATPISKLIKYVTKHPYTHSSIAFDEKLQDLWSYNIYTQKNGFKGGLVKESLLDFTGSKYSLYELSCTKEIYDKVRDKVEEIAKDVPGTGYNILGLINNIYQKVLFKQESEIRLFCSQFVVVVLRAAGIEIFKNKNDSFIKPYDFVRSKLLRFVRKGTLR
jgi:hypothetical protein